MQSLVDWLEQLGLEHRINQGIVGRSPGPEVPPVNRERSTNEPGLGRRRLPQQSAGITMFDRVILEPTMSVNVTSKGQVTIPKRVRDLLRIQPGSAVDFQIEADGRVILRKVGRAAKTRSRFAVLRGRATVRMRTEEIMALTRGEV